MKPNPHEFEIVRLEKQDVDVFRKLVEVFREVFETESSSTPGESYLQTVLAKPGFHVFVVLRSDDEVVGGLTAFELPMYRSESTELFIYDVGIHPAFQRKGLGQELLTTVKEFCRENNIHEMFVPAHEEDDHALKFYGSAGGKAERVVQFVFDVNNHIDT
ncbi:MAG TPA: GNAT family N-acetyltransferase [Bacteroidia bacterium]|nr:GNAT family N-acetyltransferase [Bacteroidia bacterium]